MADALGTAYGVILDRIRSSRDYIRALEMCADVVKSITTGVSVEWMRGMGGYTEIIRRVLNDYSLDHPELSKNVGSTMIPMTVMDVLFLDRDEIRVKSQR